jgi:hypothetical protein
MKDEIVKDDRSNELANCYGTNLTRLLMTAIIQLRSPLAEPQAKRTLPRQMIELSELDHLDHN